MKTPVSGAGRWFATAALALVCGAAAAQEYPSRPIRFLLPFAPGGIGDLTARVVAQKMSENMGQNVVVDNRPGAGMILSATAALQSAADGYTMVLAGNGTAISASLFKSVAGIEAQVVPFKGTPRTVVARLNKEIVTALGSPEVKLKLSALGAEPYPSTPEQTRERMRSEIARWKAVIERANIPRQ